MQYIKILTLIGALGLSSLAFGQATGTESVKGKAWDDLEKQLSNLTQKGMTAVRAKQLDASREAWTDQFFEINSGGTVRTKAQQLERLQKRPLNQNAGPFSDDFKLMAVYGDLALATDHTTLKGVSDKGHDFSGEYRVLRVFVKDNGKWKVAATAMCPIIPH